MNVLVVTSPFGGHEVGHRITDAAEITQVLSGEHSQHVVRAVHEVETSDSPAEAAEQPPHTDEHADETHDDSKEA